MSGNSSLTKLQQTFFGRLVLYGRGKKEWELFLGDLPKGYVQDGQFAINKTKSSDRVLRDDFIKRLAMFLFDFRVHPDDSSIVYYKKHSATAYCRCTEKALAHDINELWNMFFDCTPVKEVDDCVKNILRNVMKTADTRNRVYRLTDNLYFVPDEKSSIVSLPPEGKECFFTLDGPYSLFNGSEEMIKLLKESYDNFLSILDSEIYGQFQFKNFYEDLPRDFEWIRLWSAEDVEGYKDRYWDIMCAFSTPFHKKLIEKAYLFDGTTRTGKSTCRNVIEFTFGKDKTAKVRIPDYNNYHVNNVLAYCCVNSPDEELGGMVSKEACANFKTFATKGEVELPVKNKQPIHADGQFMSFHPTNSNIEWPDGESSPCLQRCLIIKFFKYLGDFDMNGKDFITSTFKDHPEEYAKFLGQVFALASYFSRDDKEFFTSDKMKETNEYIAEETNSLDLYYRYFFKFFDGVTNEGFLWEDYQFACWQFGWVQQSKSALRQRFGLMLMQKPKPRKIGMRSVRYVRHPKFSSPQVLFPDYEIHVLDEFAQSDTTPWGNAENMHDHKLSVVATLFQMEEQRKAAEEEKKLDKGQKGLEGII